MLGDRLAIDAAACANVKVCSSLSDVETWASRDNSSKIGEGIIVCGGSKVVDLDVFFGFFDLILFFFFFVRSSE